MTDQCGIAKTVKMSLVFVTRNIENQNCLLVTRQNDNHSPGTLDLPNEVSQGSGTGSLDS